MKISVSLTTIFDNIKMLKPCLFSLLHQTVPATNIYLFISREPYLLDKGFSEVPAWLSKLPISIRWVPNTGPYRKLLPLLKEKWNSDEVIITVDDDTVYEPDLIEKMVAKYIESGGACVACRVNYLSGPANQYKLTEPKDSSIANFHSGKGGVLYHPSMFKQRVHPHCEGGIFETDYLTLCKTADDIWFNLWRMYNGVPCVVIKDYRYMMGDLTNKEFALYNRYNEIKNVEMYSNTVDFIFCEKLGLC